MIVLSDRHGSRPNVFSEKPSWTHIVPPPPSKHRLGLTKTSRCPPRLKSRRDTSKLLRCRRCSEQGAPCPLPYGSSSSSQPAMQSVRGKHISDRKWKACHSLWQLRWPYTQKKKTIQLVQYCWLYLHPVNFCLKFLYSALCHLCIHLIFWILNKTYIVPKWLQIITSAFLNLSLTSLISSSRSSSLFPFSSPAKLGLQF